MRTGCNRCHDTPNGNSNLPTYIVREHAVFRKWPYLPSYVMSLSDIDSKIKNVIDMVFLYDFFEPTLAILYSPQQTWTG